MSVGKFKICTVGWNCEQFIPWTLESLEQQEISDWQIAIVYDPSDDNGAQVIEEWCAKDPVNRLYRINDERKFAPRNQYEAVYEMLQPEDDDVIVFLDLDGDRLSHPRVLNRLHEEYSKGTLLTYGQYRPEPNMGTSTFASEWPEEVVRRNRYRKHILTSGPCFNHLRTIKACVFKAIPSASFHWGNGKWYEGATDYVVMVSGLELAGGRHKFIEDVLLVYNHANPLADNLTHPTEATACCMDFLRRPALDAKEF